jgi:heterodisulfide reductase subunit C
MDGKMKEAQNIIDLNQADPKKFQSWNFLQDFCITCGLCSSSCPASGIDGFDPRKVVRMVSLGIEKELVDSKFPWICTMCGKCEEVCPMQIDIPDLVRKIRSLRDPDKVPGTLHKGLMAVLKTGNNLGLPKDDFIFIMEDVGEEIAEEPGFEGFKVPLDKKGANIMTTIHNKLVNTQNEDLKHWWKIFYAAGEDWTIPVDNWEGVNWGYFNGDDDAMKTLTGRVLENMRRLEVKTLMWPE